MSEKYTYYEVGKGDTWHIWDCEVRVLRDNFFFCLASSVEDAELVCRILNENENFLKLSDELKHKIEDYDLVLSAIEKSKEVVK